MLIPPVEAVRPTRVPRLPETMRGGILYQAKLDGHRVLAFIDAGAVVLQARSGRIVTDRFPEILPALAALAPGTVLDGEVVAWRDTAFDFPALASTPAARRRSGAAVSYTAFDLLCAHGIDIREKPLAERWPRLLAALEAAPVQVQPIMTTRERDQAESWLHLLAPVGVEGLVCKALASTYRNTAGTWVKYRTSDTVDAELIAALGPEGQVRAARIRLPDGRELTTLALTRAQADLVAGALAARPTGGPASLVEVKVGGGARHPQVRFVRVRANE